MYFYFKEIPGLGTILFKVPKIHREEVFDSRAAIFRFKNYMRIEAENVLTLVLNRYRKQVIAKKISNISFTDERKLFNLKTPEELCNYNGLVHIIDLAMIFEEILFYFVPNNIQISTKERLFLIDQYNAWVECNCIDNEFLHSLNDFDSMYNMVDTLNDPYKSSRLLSSDKNYYIPCGIFQKPIDEIDPYIFKPRNTKIKYSTKHSDIRVFLRIQEAVIPIKKASNKMKPKEITVIKDVLIPYDSFRHWFLDISCNLIKNRELNKLQKRMKKNERYHQKNIQKNS